MTITTTKTQYRSLSQVYKGINTSDGDGVKLTRIIGTNELNMLDPFLLLDCFESDQASDYIGGFPTHPHRGFETVTYLLNGKMRHKDSTGNEGVIEPGGVQWMTAGKGILHSEMPEQEHGLLKGYQLWVNLPQEAKMVDPGYQEFPPEKTPLEERADGTSIRVISGATNQGTIGPVKNHYTVPTYLHVSMLEGATFVQDIPASHNAFVYVTEGTIAVNSLDGASNKTASRVTEKHIGILSQGEERLSISASSDAQFLLLAGKPLNEPVVRGGPFVMNTRQELMQAFHDYSNGVLV
ncbi:pirin family protein [Vibrio sp. 10N.261.55.A7]|uniref:pirin family protein n=1 Tax=Vibrio sp. 10N.261.55.A7 TaxID=1880851 RepID=UPI000C81C92A|nr:pirin family protein [Vibrio sp. 10N.261.55.A7]PMJ99552.1 quercetin 2,3-dioxygenase [Vibrio sp. 10N.261.55.A7]